MIVSIRNVLREVHVECDRAFVKFGPQYDLADGHGDNLYPWYPSAAGARAMCDLRAEEGRVTWADILAEEVCEANEEGGRASLLRAELIQVAAVAIRWVDAIDNRRMP